jgi:hypothetical protein
MPPTIFNKRGTALALSSNNPILGSGELCLEIDTRKIKFGDGATPWNNLQYAVLPNSGVSIGFPTISGGSGNFNNLSVNGTSVSVNGHSHSSSDITNFNTSVSGLINGIYAPLNSPTLTGVPLAPTASTGTNTNQIASTQFVRTEISNLVNAAPSALDTLNELAAALGNDANFSTTVTNGLAQKANISGTNFTGTVTAPTGNFTILQQNGVAVSINGHTHTSSSITDFNSSISGLLPVKNVGGSEYIGVSNLNGNYTVFATGLQPSGNYANSIHSHVIGDITGLQTALNGKAPLANPSFTGTVDINGTLDATTVVADNVEILSLRFPTTNHDIGVSSSAVSVRQGLGAWQAIVLENDSRLSNARTPTAHTHDDRYYTESEVDNLLSFKQPSGNYSIVGHSHTSSDITDFNNSVSGLLPVTNIVSGTNISIIPSGTSYRISVSGSLGLTSEDIDDRVNSLLVAGSGIGLSYNDVNNTLTISNISNNITENYTFEIISKNIKSYPSSMFYDNNGNLLSIAYATNNGNIIKTFNRDTNNKIISIVLSGALPSGISTTKNFTYLDNNLVATSYN